MSRHRLSEETWEDSLKGLSPIMLTAALPHPLVQRAVQVVQVPAGWNQGNNSYLSARWILVRSNWCAVSRPSEAPHASKLHSPHSARPGQEHSWPDLVEPVDRRMERSPPRARFLRKHAQTAGAK
ncbi:uncharacterized protein LOC144992343 [Oryzias latipes]